MLKKTVQHFRGMSRLSEEWSCCLTVVPLGWRTSRSVWSAASLLALSATHYALKREQAPRTPSASRGSATAAALAHRWLKPWTTFELECDVLMQSRERRREAGSAKRKA